ncbi:hypothetical protein [Aureimonas jatrophae]|uniref:Uncharacterized protein n=1 Tax=Aureimonas jatrophae TaxID=1166073 RepID=A0A1H0EWM9_9HYPH|nr:hypothetical protein [Aureimonas jatrophae]MBB3950280.1 hypothetical protein [Aureimonas jatrophae]SDN86794.1 hypothetical protein SAMN05192530_102254 [Aureimonas jatrophae]
MTSIDPASDTVLRRRAPRPRRETVRRWRDGALTLAAFGLVAALVFGTLPATQREAASSLLADAASSR